MDISGAQLNSAAISAYNAQLQTASQQTPQSRPETSPAPAAERQQDREVTLSQEGRELAARQENIEAESQPAPASPTAEAPVAAAPPVQETAAPEPAREPEPPAQTGQLSTTSFSARVAAESYYSVSNF